jgi:predicted nucleotidyltransferase component of viral defense system
MISKKQIQELAERLSIDEFTVIREYLQIVFLAALYSLKESEHIYFKGGTAIHLLFKAGRFSEDLDFTSQMTIGEVSDLCRLILKKLDFVAPGIKLKQVNEGGKSFSGLLNYSSEFSKYPLNVHLEFSLREKPETCSETALETDFPVSPWPVVRHLSWEEILAEKIRALTLRAKGRDLYDIWYLLSKGVLLDWGMIHRKLEFYGKKVSVQDLTDKVREFDDKKIKQDLQKFLASNDRGFISHLKPILIKQLESLKSDSTRL